MTKPLIPLEAYRFRVLPLGVGHDAAQTFSEMVTKTSLDLAAKTLSITAIQNRNTSTFQAVGLVVGESHTVIVDLLSRNGMIAFSLELAVKTIAHSMDLDYGSSQTLVHKLVVEFDRIQTLPGELAPESTGVVVPSVEVPEGTFITPQEACDLMDQAVAEKVDVSESSSVDDTDVERQAD